jgi:hypothetical protein
MQFGGEEVHEWLDLGRWRCNPNETVGYFNVGYSESSQQ